MAKTLPLDKPGAVRLLGVAFVALMLLVVWVTYAFFDKKFADSEFVYITTERTGVNLPKNADVKLRGMIVGEVREIVPDGDGVKMTLAMKPDLLDQVPRDVSAQLLPKTLFGEKFVALIPDEDASSARLKPGDTITRASVPIEVEELLNNSYPLLTAVEPGNISTTLTAVAEALSGRGEQLGDTLVTTNEYLTELNPDVPLLVDDLEKFGRVADGYTAVMPDLARLLRNTTTTTQTLRSKEAEFSAFLRQGTKLSNTLTTFTKANRKTIIELNRDSRPVLDMVARYSPTFPCFLKGMRGLVPMLDSAFRDQMLHINIDLIEAPTPYDDKTERLVVSEADDLDDPAANPTCLNLAAVSKAHGSDDDPTNDDRGPGSPYGTPKSVEGGRGPFTIPPEVYNLVKLTSDHNKFPEGTGESNRPAAESSGRASLNSDASLAAYKAIVGATVGVAPEQVSDLSAILLEPVAQGKVVVGR